MVSEPGEACIVDADCPEAFICRANESACKTCVPVGQRDGDCIDDADCAEDLICVNTTSPGTCQEPLGFDELCSERGECASDYSCNEALDPPRCQRRRKQDVGESCSEHIQCRSHLICNEALDSPQCAMPGDVGDVCVNQSDCEIDLVCDREMSPPQCAVAGSEGQSCFANEECPGGTICHHLSEAYWSCRAPSQKNEACGWDYDCVDALICMAGSCVEPKLEGEACSYPFECEKPPLECAPDVPPDCVPPRMVCNQAELVCTLQRENGGRCAAWTDCRHGLICNTALRPAQCRPPGDPGQACTQDSHCADGLACAQGVCAINTCP